MLLIPCPWCGPRNENEFAYQGDASIARPTNPAEVSDEAWTAYLYLRDNPRGVHQEHWNHRYGCRQWFELTRNTLDHSIVTDAAAASPESSR
ncbi:MAG: sarcosine oxidase subunit delta [Ideonella sp.]